MTTNTITAADFISDVASRVAASAFSFNAPREVVGLVRRLEVECELKASAAYDAARYDDSDEAALAACNEAAKVRSEYAKTIVIVLTRTAAAYAYHELVGTDEEFNELETLRYAMSEDPESEAAEAAYYAAFNKRAETGLAMLPADRSVFLSAYNAARNADYE